VTAEAVDTEGAVVVAYVHSQNVAYSWHHSIIELLGNDLHNSQRVWRAGYISMTGGTDGLADARNKAVVKFLEEKAADWLFWIDTDMGFPADVIERLMEVADPVERPVVGGLCFTWRQEQSDGMGGWRCLATPTIFDWGHTDDGAMGFTVNFNYAHDAVQQCAGTGSACVLIHRSVFEAILEKYKPLGQMWYDRVPNPGMGTVVSEDLSFCMRANTVGKNVWVDSSVKTTHQKTLWLSEDDYFGQRALAQMVPKVPEATEATAVIVPVLGRPQNAVPFMQSWGASGAKLARVYAVADESDDETTFAWRDAGATVLHFPDDGRPGTFAEKVNHAYLQTDEPWLFLVGDDVRFRPGWLDQAQHASRDGAHVIGTNDLHNPRVIAGEHATHMLIRRAYVDERGSSWDGPKVVCHEGYRHNFVDNEIVTAAQQRGVWAFAKYAKVEHLHPLWGGAPDDETYALGRSHIEEDKALFESRALDYL
jgi:glycosyltransferase involved in cell wall biosynthesis